MLLKNVKLSYEFLLNLPNDFGGLLCLVSDHVGYVAAKPRALFSSSICLIELKGMV